MTQQDLLYYRLVNQQLVRQQVFSPNEVAKWMGAIQAQDYEMAKWAIGVRMIDGKNEKIEAAIEKRQIFRTHVLRPTWHIVAAEDIRWMLSLTAPYVKRFMSSTNKKIGLEEAVLNRCNELIVKILSKERELTRPKLMEKLEKEGVDTQGFRSSHIMMNAELDQIVCNGVWKEKQLTYALLDNVVPISREKEQDEALAELAKRYFFSHAPAQIEDFIWWSGLPVKLAKEGLALIKPLLTSIELDGKVYWLPASLLEIDIAKMADIQLLPAFDEYLISYKDRSAALDISFSKEVIVSNGIFRPIVVENGKVIGSWKKIQKKTKPTVEIHLFNKEESSSDLAKAVEKFHYFYENE